VYLKLAAEFQEMSATKVHGESGAVMKVLVWQSQEHLAIALCTSTESVTNLSLRLGLLTRAISSLSLVQTVSGMSFHQQKQ